MKKLKMKTLTIQVRTTYSNADLKKITFIEMNGGEFLGRLHKLSVAEKNLDDTVGIFQISVQDNTK